MDKTRQIRTEEMLQALQALYPRVFTNDSTRMQPLKIGIQQDLLKQLHGRFSRKSLRRALKLYARQPAYRAHLQVNIARIDLDGNPCGIVTIEHLAIGKAYDQRQQQRTTDKSLHHRQRQRQRSRRRAKKAALTSGSPPDRPDNNPAKARTEHGKYPSDKKCKPLRNSSPPVVIVKKRRKPDFSINSEHTMQHIVPDHERSTEK